MSLSAVFLFSFRNLSLDKDAAKIIFLIFQTQTLILQFGLNLDAARRTARLFHKSFQTQTLGVT